MKLDLKALSGTAAALWSGCVLVVGLAHMAWPGYGTAFLELCASIYPGYTVSGSIGSVVVGTLYAFLDGAVGGFVFGWLYNRLTGCCATSAPSE